MSSENLTAKTFRGLKWNYLSTAVIAVLQIGYTAMMARLLEPVDFGLVAMANVILRFGQYFSQMGLGSALIQKKELLKEEVRASFTSGVLLGLLMFGLFFLLAPYSNILFSDEHLPKLVKVMALSFAINGISLTSVSLLRRELRFKDLAIAEIASFSVGYLIFGIGAALLEFKVWSLVIASMSQSILIAFLSYFFVRHELRFTFSWENYRKLYGFGGKVSIISFLEFVSSSLDTFFIGRVLGSQLLGIYNRAFMLVNLPIQNLTTAVSRVLLPSFSRLQGDQERIDRSYRAAMLVLGSLLFPLCFGIAGAAREIVLAVLGEKWTGSIPLLRILALSTPFMMLAHIGGVLLEATAKLTVKFYIQLGNISLLLILFAFLLPYGLVAIASAVLGTSIGIFIAYTSALDKLLALSQKRSYLHLSSGFLSGCVVFCLLFIFSSIVTSTKLNIMLAFSLQLVLGAAVAYLVLISPMQKPLRMEILSRLLQLNTQPRVYKLVQRLLCVRPASVHI